MLSIDGSGVPALRNIFFAEPGILNAGSDISAPAAIHLNTSMLDKEIPEMPSDEMEKLPVLSLPVDKLAISKACPYGLTPDKIDVLKKDNNINTIEELAGSPDETLLSIQGIEEKFLKQIRDVVGQAIWM